MFGQGGVKVGSPVMPPNLRSGMLQNFLKELNLKTNESTRIDCPICFNKNTFSATNDGRQTIYNCFHADCSIKGKARSPLSKRLFQEIEKQKEPE